MQKTDEVSLKWWKYINTERTYLQQSAQKSNVALVSNLIKYIWKVPIPSTVHTSPLLLGTKTSRPKITWALMELP